jgi:diacylglycerol kinase family enzyme
VINSNAGSSSKFSEEALKAASPDATFEILFASPEELSSAFDKAFGAKPTAVIVVGGDGTARTAAVRAVQTGVPIIPMPGGTMNVLPKIIFDHGDMTRAIADLPRLKPSSLDVGCVSGEMFFLSAAFGLAGPMARLREATRSEHKFDRVMKAAGALLRSIRPSLECRVRWRTPGEKWRNAHSLIVAIGDIERILSPDGEDHGSRFEVAALKLRSVWQMFAFGAAFVSGAWRNSKNLKIVRAREVEIVVPSKRPLVVLDGEPIRVARVGSVTLVRGALPVLAMPHNATSAPAQRA